MKSAGVAMVPAAALLFGGACAGRSDPGLGDEVAQGPAYRPVEGATAPIWVPAGIAWVGVLTLNPTTHQVGAVSCLDTQVPLPTAPYVVPSFYLDQDETSIEVYDRCVDAGACTPRDPTTFPTTPRFPVSVDRDRATQLCTWRGGFLPSYAQLRRAEVGDAEAALPAPAKVLWPWFDCIEVGFATPACEALGRRIPKSFQPSEPIRSDATDVGPYGHYDLFGSQWELTTTTWYGGTEEEQHARQALDCLKQGQALPDLSGGSVYIVFAPAQSLGAFTPGLNEDFRIGITEDFFQNVPAMWGVRCAYSSIAEGL